MNNDNENSHDTKTIAIVSLIIMIIRIMIASAMFCISNLVLHAYVNTLLTKLLDSYLPVNEPFRCPYSGPEASTEACIYGL